VSELHDLTAVEQGAAVRRGEVSPHELAAHYLERVDEVGAFVTRTSELALARAGSLLPVPDDAAPLYGVPTAIKDLNLTAGVRTTFGSAAFADYVPDVSDAVTLAIEAAGMVSLGKTNTPEFGSPCYTEPDVAPAAVTPWDRTRMAGGSSGGAAAAVAAGLVPVAQGSDGGGSIRIPASCCGLVGLKPTRGRISGYPMYGEVTGLATAGTLARSVRDAAALLDVLAGRGVGDPSWAPPPDEPFLAACDRDPGRLRIARFLEPVITDVEVDPACVAAYESASALLTSLGHDVEDIAVPMPREAVPTFETCWAVLAALSPVPRSRSGCCGRSPAGWRPAAGTSAARSSGWRWARCGASRPVAPRRWRRTTRCSRRPSPYPRCRSARCATTTTRRPTSRRRRRSRPGRRRGT
jgi:amidase